MSNRRRSLLLFGIEHAPSALLDPIAAIVLAAIAGSVLLHGATATTLLDRYFRTTNTAR